LVQSAAAMPSFSHPWRSVRTPPDDCSGLRSGAARRLRSSRASCQTNIQTKCVFRADKQLKTSNVCSCNGLHKSGSAQVFAERGCRVLHSATHDDAFHTCVQAMRVSVVVVGGLTRSRWRAKPAGRRRRRVLRYVKHYWCAKLCSLDKIERMLIRPRGPTDAGTGPAPGIAPAGDPGAA